MCAYEMAMHYRSIPKTQKQVRQDLEGDPDSDEEVERIGAHELAGIGEQRAADACEHRANAEGRGFHQRQVESYLLDLNAP